MGIWQELLCSIIFAVVSAFLVAKLIALVVSYKYQGSNSTVVAYENESYFSEFPWDRVVLHESLEVDQELSPEKEQVRQVNIEDSVFEGTSPGFSLQNNEFGDQDKESEENDLEPEDEVMLEKKQKEVIALKENIEFYCPDEKSKKNGADDPALAELFVKEESGQEDFGKDIQPEEKKEFRITETSLLSDEDEWEKVENFELDEIFGEATVYVSSMAANLSQKIPNEVQTKLYELDKIVTDALSNIPQPSLLKMDARAKWKLEEDHSNANEGYAAGLLQLLDQKVPVDSRETGGGSF